VARSLSVLRAAAELTWERRADIDPDCLPFAVLALTWVGDFDQARELINRLLPKARTESAFGYLCFLLYAAAYLEARTGHLVAASALAAEGVLVAETTSNSLWHYLSLCCLAFIEAAQGRDVECREHADTAVEMARQQEFAYPATIQDALGLLELSLGHAEQAIVHLEPVNVRPGSTQPTLGRPTGPDLIESYVRCGRELPETILAQLQMVSADERFPAAAAAAARCLGLAAVDEEMDRHFTRSLQLQARVSNPFALARTEFCYGERLRRAGRRKQAREHLLRAHALFVESGASVWASRVNDELRAAGGPARRSITGGIAELTPQEVQVALTVANGATNREAGAELYISPKTVEFHLSQIYRKLGIRSRSELTAEVVKVQPRNVDLTIATTG
jgi:DNA-binding CsgD family transcriptional regulator